MEAGQRMIEVPVMADVHSRGQCPEYLYWVGCAGAFDDRYRRVTRAFARILDHFQVSYAILGSEETCTGDPARRAGNEMLYQMQALQVIETLNRYNIRKILTTCPHCYNILKNEYPDLGGNYEVLHYTQLLAGLLKEEAASGFSVSFHDPCYLGRANDIYDEPREILRKLGIRMAEMKRNRSFALCCGAGGAQMFKEAEHGHKEVFIERTEDFLETGATIVATACPFCMTMLTDGIKYKHREEDLKNLDIAELVALVLQV